MIWNCWNRYPKIQGSVPRNHFLQTDFDPSTIIYWAPICPRLQSGGDTAMNKRQGLCSPGTEVADIHCSGSADLWPGGPILANPTDLSLIYRGNASATCNWTAIPLSSKFWNKIRFGELPQAFWNLGALMVFNQFQSYVQFSNRYHHVTSLIKIALEFTMQLSLFIALYRF